MASESVSVRLAQREDYEFEVDFGEGIARLQADEPPPLGRGRGPAPMQLLAAAVGNCLADSLLFALRKFKQRPEPMRCEVRVDIGRNAEGRLRAQHIDATLTLGVAAGEIEHLERALAQFEAFCTVTQSIAPAIPVSVHVRDAQGATLK